MRFEDFIQPCLDLLMSRLRKHAEQGHVVNMSDWTNALAFDIVGELAYGRALGQLETETDHMGIRENIGTGFYFASNMGHWLGDSIWVKHPLVGRISAALGLPNPFGEFNAWVATQVSERQTSEGKAEREVCLEVFDCPARLLIVFQSRTCCIIFSR